MNAYLASVLEIVRTKHGNEPEFVQTVEEVFSSIEPVIEKHPEYEKVDLLGRMVEPERMFTFRVVWCDDNGQWHTNCKLALLSSPGAIGPPARPAVPEEIALRGHYCSPASSRLFKTASHGLHHRRCQGRP